VDTEMIRNRNTFVEALRVFVSIIPSISRPELVTVQCF
jgi:hypothetical protein